MKKQFHNKFIVFLAWMACLYCLWPPVHAGADISIIKAVRDGISADQRFGHSVAVYGDEVIIGVYRDDEQQEDAGAVYIFKTSGGVWVQKNKFTRDDAWPHEYLGWSVAISSDYAMAGAPNREFGTGAVCVFRKSNQEWIFDDRLTAGDDEKNDNFGCSVAISGDYAVIGAYRDDDKGYNAGAAYIFKRDGYEWVQQAKLTPAGVGAGDYFGRSVAIYGDDVMVGAIHDNDKGESSGAVYWFKRLGDQWYYQKKITAGDGGTDDFFGFSVALSENYAVIGAIGDDEQGSNAGAVYTYRKDAFTWTWAEKLRPVAGSDGARFGASVSVSDTYAIVGADGDDGAASNAGTIYLFQNTNNAWSQKDKLTPSGIAAENRLGWSTAIYSEGTGQFTAVAGSATGDDGAANSGTAYFFSDSSEPNIEVTPTVLNVYKPRQAEPTAPGTSTKDNSGYPRGLRIPDSVIEYWENRIRPPRKPLSGTLPSQKDWSHNDSPVKNQGSCGSCSAFAAVALIENLANKLGLSQAQDLSEQAIISCSSDFNCATGGWYWEALNYVKESGLPPEGCFLYEGKDLSCDDKCEYPDFLARVDSFTSGPGMWGGDPDITDLKIALQDGPLCVALAAPSALDSYSGGIFDYNEASSIDWSNNAHAVLLVGYNDDEQYFKAKNSWGAGWGENGYFRIAYNDVEGEMKFGSFACNASGLYLEGERSTFTIANRGAASLKISGIESSDNSWLSVTPIIPNDGLYIGANEQQTMTVSVDWDVVGNNMPTGIITINSSDPDTETAYVTVNAKISSLIKSLKGNVDGIGGVTLADAILTLKILSGIPITGNINLDADVNEDSRIDFVELIYILQTVSKQ